MRMSSGIEEGQTDSQYLTLCQNIPVHTNITTSFSLSLVQNWAMMRLLWLTGSSAETSGPVELKTDNWVRGILLPEVRAIWRSESRENQLLLTSTAKEYQNLGPCLSLLHGVSSQDVHIWHEALCHVTSKTFVLEFGKTPGTIEESMEPTLAIWIHPCSHLCFEH